MSKALKKLIVDELVADYRDDKNLIIANFGGIDAQKTNVMRRDLGGKNIKLRVVKNSLAAIALEKVGISGLDKMLFAPTAIASNNDDPVELAKNLTKCAKDIDGLNIVGGWVDGELMSSDSISVLASIPSREAVLTQVVFAIKAPMVQLVNVFNATARNLCLVLNAIKEKKSDV